MFNKSKKIWIYKSIDFFFNKKKMYIITIQLDTIKTKGLIRERYIS